MGGGHWRCERRHHRLRNHWPGQNPDWNGEGWHGGELFEVEGHYDDKELGVVAKAVKKFYKLRQKYKKNKDPREYSIKIVINTSYGLLWCKTFSSVCDVIAASESDAERELVARVEELSFLYMHFNQDKVEVNKDSMAAILEDIGRISQGIISKLN